MSLPYSINWMSNSHTPKTMKKILIIALIAILLISCAFGQFFGPSAEAVPTSTETHTPPPTATPIPPTVTFTPTPTLIVLSSPTVLPEIETIIESSITPLALITPNTPTPTVQMKGFLSIFASQDEFFKGRQCEPASVKITAQVTDFLAVAHVLLFVRFKSLTSERASKWTNIPMHTIGAGTYVHDLYSDEMLEDGFFQNAWVEYQIVSTNQFGRELGRTAVFKEKIKMLECVPTPIPIVTETLKP